MDGAQTLRKVHQMELVLMYRTLITFLKMSVGSIA